MEGLESQTIGGLNELIEKQSKQEGRTIVTAVLFDDRYEILWNGIDAKEARLTEKELGRCIEWLTILLWK